jgi:hypothetical protein
MRTRIVAAAGVLALVGGVAWFVLEQEARRAERERGQALLLEFDERAVVALTLTNRGEEWRFERRPHGWRVVRPVEDAADDVAVHELLAATRKTEVRDVIEQPEALSAYGLDPATSVLRIEGAGTAVLHVGNLTPPADAMYVRVEDRPGVLVVDRWEGLELGVVVPEALRDRSLTGLRASAITELGIERGGARVRLLREGESWWLAEPLRVPASSVEVDGLLAALGECRVVRFLDGADPRDPRFGLGDGALRLVVRAGDSARTLILGAVDDAQTRYALRDDRATVLGVQQQPLESAPLAFDRLATTQLTNVNRYRVTRFEYRDRRSGLAAVREGERGWKRPDGRVLDEGRVYGLLAGLLGAPVSGWVEGEPAAGEAPAAALDLELEGGAKERIEFFSGRRARVGSVAGVTCRLRSEPPAVPEL